MSPYDAPLVTIAIPLYRARSFVDRILENIRAADYPNLEFLIADQHCHDEAAEILRARLSDDPRVRIVTTRDELGWIGNYNYVLAHASGKYVRILAQDDRLLPGSFAPAIEALESDCDAVMAEGPVHVVDIEGTVIRDDATDNGGAWRRRLPWQPLWLAARLAHRQANLGLFRTAVLRRDRLRVPPTAGSSGLSMRAFLFALALRGPIAFADGYENHRCVHADSFTARHWTRGLTAQVERTGSYFVACQRELWRCGWSLPRRCVWTAGLVVACLVALPLTRVVSRLFTGAPSELFAQKRRSASGNGM